MSLMDIMSIVRCHLLVMSSLNFIQIWSSKPQTSFYDNVKCNTLDIFFLFTRVQSSLIQPPLMSIFYLQCIVNYIFLCVHATFFLSSFLFENIEQYIYLWYISCFTVWVEMNLNWFWIELECLYLITQRSGNIRRAFVACSCHSLITVHSRRKKLGGLWLHTCTGLHRRFQYAL